jgi:hypothetical protein
LDFFGGGVYFCIQAPGSEEIIGATHNNGGYGKCGPSFPISPYLTNKTKDIIYILWGVKTLHPLF